MKRTAVTEEALDVMIASGTAREFRANRGPGGQGWTFSVRLGGYWLPLRSRREPVRVWASLTAVERFATGKGIGAVLVEL